MNKVERWKFNRPEVLKIVDNPTLTVDVIITCRNSQEKLDLALAALSVQNYPEDLIHVHIVDDGSLPKLTMPPIHPKNSTLHYYENEGGNWGKSKSTNSVARKSKADVLWFLDSDMIVEPSHLSHHMKWHHQATDYVVLGWKKFVEDWSYDPHSLATSIKDGNFLKLHSDGVNHGYWEARVDSSNEFRSDDLENFRALVGATFSLSNENWQFLGGYDQNFITSEDTELGWRCILQGLRFVPERDALSWHLGLTTIENNRDVILSHNNPLLANKIPALSHLRRKGGLEWDVPENEFLIDCRLMTIDSFFAFIQPLLKDVQGQSKFRLLANWPKLTNRYSPTDDQYKDLREIQRWCESDEKFKFETVSRGTYLKIDEILELIQIKSTPFYFFAEGNLKSGIEAQQLKASLLQSGNGLEGIVDNGDHRFFVAYAPAISTAKRTAGSTYKNLEESWGVKWHCLEDFQVTKKPLLLRSLLFIRYCFRRVIQVKSFDQLKDLLRRGFMVYKDKILKEDQD